MAVLSMELPLGNPSSVDEVVQRISRNSEFGHRGGGGNITTDVNDILNELVEGANTGDPVLCLESRGSYCGLSVGAGLFQEGSYYGRGFAGTGVSMVINQAHEIETKGSVEKPEPVVQIGEISTADQAFVSLLSDFPNPLDDLRKNVRSVVIGEKPIQERVSGMEGPWKFASLVALRSTGVAVDCELEASDQEKARESLFLAIARFAAYHSDPHAAKHSAYSLVMAAHVLRPSEDELREKSRLILAEHLGHRYQSGLQEKLADCAVDWLIDQIQDPTGVAPRQVAQTVAHGL